MTGFNHTLAGATIALIVHEPILVAPLAFLSHFLLDMMPHFGRHPKFTPYSEAFKKYLLLDAMLCVVVLGFAISLAPELWLVIAWGAAWATLPDFLWFIRPYTNKKLEWFYTFHERIQWGERPYGWIYELLYTAVGIALLLRID